MKAGWEEVALGEVTQSINGLWKGKKPPFRKARVLRNTNFRSHGKLSLDDVAEIEVQVSQFAKRKLQKGDIILERSGGGPKQPVGRVAYFNEDGDDFSFSNFTSVIRVSDQRLDPRYLLQVLNGWHYLGETEKLQKRSTGIRNLRFAEYKAKTIPLPPLEEQKRIVAVLDAAFAKLDRARTNVEANLSDAEECYTIATQELFFDQNFEVESATLGDLVEVASGSGFPKSCQGLQDEQHPFFKVSDMNTPGNEFALTSANNYISEDTRKALGARVIKKSAIVFPKVGGAISTNKKRVMSVDGCVDNNIMALLPDKEIVMPNYLHEWLRAFDIFEFSNKAALPSITQKTVKAWPIQLPSRDKQRDCVEKAVSLRAKMELVRNSLATQLADLDALRQSLLQRAFAGELT